MTDARPAKRRQASHGSRSLSEASIEGLTAASSSRTGLGTTAGDSAASLVLNSNEAAGGIPSLKDVGYPVSISLLVDDLLGLGDGDVRGNGSAGSSSNHRSGSFRSSASFHSCTVRFRTLNDVGGELRRMVDRPDR